MICKVDVTVNGVGKCAKSVSTHCIKPRCHLHRHAAASDMGGGGGGQGY